MNVLEFTILLFGVAFLAGFLGSLTGLGGGLVIIPFLTLVLGVNIRYAIGASLISVIATSSGAAAAYIKEGFTNIRLGMFLEVATTLGALLGAYLAGWISPSVIAVIFGLVLIYSAFTPDLKHAEVINNGETDRLATRLNLNSSYPTEDGDKEYNVKSVPGGFGLMFIAGSLSGLLGIGSGALKVIAMDQVMKVPFKVSTTTSNFMIGVTAAASVGVYLNRGYVDPGLAMPVMLGVLIGSLFGAKFLIHSKTKYLKIIFRLVILFLAIEMLYKGISGGF